MPYVSKPGTKTGSSHAGAERVEFIIGAANMAAPGIAAVAAGFANLTSVGMRTASAMNEAMTITEAGFMAVGAAAALALGVAVHEAAQFEKQLKLVQAVSDDLSNENLGKMGDQIKALAMKYGESADEIASSMQTIGRAGIKDATAQMNLFEDALKMAKIEGMDLQDAIDGIIKTTNLFGGNMDNPQEFVKQANTITQQLVHASQISPTDVSDLLMGLKYIGGSAQTAGWSSADTMSNLAYMATKGVSGETAATAIRGFITKPAMQGPQVTNALSTIGLTPSDLWEPGGNKAKSLPDQIALINQKMNDAGLSTMSKLGLWAQITMQKTSQQMLKIDPQELEKYNKKMEEKFDLDQKVATAMDSISEQFNRFKASIGVLAIGVGERVLPVFRLLVDGLNALVGILNSSPQALTLFTGALVTAVGLGAYSVMKWLGGALSFFKEYVTYGSEGAAMMGSRFAGLMPSYAAIQSAEEARIVKATEAAAVINAEADANLRLAASMDAFTQASMASAMTGPGLVGGTMKKGNLRGIGPMTEQEWLQVVNARSGKGFSNKDDALKHLEKTYSSDMDKLNVKQKQYAETVSANALMAENLRKDRQAVYGGTIVDGLADKEKRFEEHTKKMQKQNREINILKKDIAMTEDRIATAPTVITDGIDANSSKWDRMKGRVSDVGTKIKQSFEPKNSLAAKAGLISIAEGGEVAGGSMAALAASLTSVIPLIVVVAAVGMTLYAIHRSQVAAVERANDAYKKSVQAYNENNEKIKELSNNINNLPASKKVELEVAIKNSDALAEDMAAKFEDKARAKAGMWFDSSTGQAAMASKTYKDSPKFLYEHMFDPKGSTMRAIWPKPMGDPEYASSATRPLDMGYTYGIGDWQDNQVVFAQLNELWPTLKILADKQMYLDANKGSMGSKDWADKQKQIYDELTPYYGKDKESLEIKKAIIRYTQMEAKIAYAKAQNEIAMQSYQQLTAGNTAKYFGILTGSLDMFSEQSLKQVDGQSSLAGQMNKTSDAMQLQIRSYANQIAWYKYESSQNDLRMMRWQINMEKFWNSLEWNPIKRAQKDAEISKHQQALDSREKNVVPLTKLQEDTYNQLMREMPGFESDLSGWLPGGGTAANTGTNTAESASGKERLLKDGYNIDFILCSKKKLPDLDPNIFKKRPLIDLTTKQIKVDNLNVHTKDDPKNIQATVRQSLIEVGDSERI